MKVDAERAYLQPEKLEREIFAEPPPEAGLSWEWLWRILKPVYGLNDAARLFFEFCKKVMVELTAEQMPGDSCTWLFFAKDAKTASGRRLVRWVSYHIDDLLISAADPKEWIVKLKARIRLGSEDWECFTYLGC